MKTRLKRLSYRIKFMLAAGVLIPGMRLSAIVLPPTFMLSISETSSNVVAVTATISRSYTGQVVLLEATNLVAPHWVQAGLVTLNNTNLVVFNNLPATNRVEFYNAYMQ